MDNEEQKTVCGAVKIYAAMSPALGGLSFFLFICYIFDGLSWLLGPPSHGVTMLWIGVIVIVSALGCVGCYMCFNQGTIYLFSLLPNVILVLAPLFWLLNRIHHFFGHVGNSMIMCYHGVVFCWLLGVICHIIVLYRNKAE